MIKNKYYIFLFLLSLLGIVSCENSGNDASYEDNTTAWATAMLTTIEMEHLIRGDSIHLSSAYILRMVMKEKAIEYYRSKGEKIIDLRGNAPLLIHYIYKYGVLPYDSYEGKKDMRCGIICKKLQRLCDTAIGRRVGEKKLEKQVDDLLDNEMGYLPGKYVYMLGAEYTPQEFAHSVCYPGEYTYLSKDISSPDVLLSIVRQIRKETEFSCGYF